MTSPTPVSQTLSESPSEPAYLRRLLGLYPTGVSVVTANGVEGDPLALVIGSFTSVSLDPPLVGFLPMRSSKTWQRMADIGEFCINVLGSDQEPICRAMAGQASRRFENVSLGRSASGLPLLDDAILHIECTQHAMLEAGDHWFVLGGVNKIAARRDRDPLIFHRGAYGSFRPL